MKASTACHPQRVYFDRVAQGLDREARWLDLGCGRRLMPLWMGDRSSLEESLTSRARLVVGVDADAAALRDNHSISLRVQADAARLPLADDSVHMVTSNMVFEHVGAPLELLKEIRRVLVPGGRFIALTPNWLDVVTLAARVIPNRLHPAIVSRIESRTPDDVYPTRYRFNRPGTVEKLLREAGFVEWQIDSLQHPDVYTRAPVLARVEAAWHAMSRRWPALRGTLLIDAR